MSAHRHSTIVSRTVLPIARPFSSFAHVDTNYSEDNPAIRRLFSIARSHSARTLIIEDIEPDGIISDENAEIGEYATDYEMKGLQKLSFWSSAFSIPNRESCCRRNCIGYAILKRDRVPSRGYDGWHIFEAVFRKYPHKHNCVPNPMDYDVTLGGIKLSLSGLLYAQQNQLNKACAQVALRSAITRILKTDISYRQINNFAKTQSSEDFVPGGGLSIPQIQAVLRGFGIGFRDFEYTQHIPQERDNQPYQQYVYSGIESGAGALIVFRFTGPSANPNDLHMIPFYGHTFNQDTWAPDADVAYFRVGENLRYLSSQYWTSSFLGHDDNFGPNVCVPRLYMRPDQVEYVAELLKPGVVICGVQAEALALQSLYSVLSEVDVSSNVWLERLAHYAAPESQQVVLRAVAPNKEVYIRHLKNNSDWENNFERRDANIFEFLTAWLPKTLWVVEVSIPQLFPANERKLGEIVLNAGLLPTMDQPELAHLLFARLPSLYLFQLPQSGGRRRSFNVISSLKSHFPVLTLR
jgi:hypothetical protein